MPTRINAFWYSAATPQHRWLAYFAEVASEFGLTLLEDRSVSRQICTEADLVAAAQEFGIPTSAPGASPSHHGLSEEDAACLTRLVDYQQLIYVGERPSTRLTIEYCDDNTYPALGIDLWNHGCQSLPAGFFRAQCEDDTICVRMIQRLQEFKSKT